MHMERQETGGKVFSDTKMLRHFGMMSYNIIGSSDHRIIGSSDHRIIGSSDHRIIGSSDHRIIGSSDHRIIGSSDHRIIGSPNMQPRGGNERGAALPSPVVAAPAFPPA